MTIFAGKGVLITGGGQGIGRATALAFAKQGALVTIGNRNETAGRRVVDEIKATGGEATFVRTDVTDEADIDRLTQKARQTMGQIDIAFNNAGVMHPALPTDELEDEDFRFVMDVNVRGVWLGMKYQIPVMLQQGGGAIINTASVLGLTAVPNNAAYVASKHAVLGLTKVAALEYGSQGIRINAISPALTDTNMAHEGLLKGDTEEEVATARQTAMEAHPIGRFAEPEEIASAVLWLAGSESSFYLGQSLTVDGGWSAR